MITFRPGQRIVSIGAGMEFVLPRGAAAADWWDPTGAGLCIWAAYQPKGAASLAASYTDLSGNGNNAGVGVAPTWDAVNGWKFNGINQYLTTTFVPQDDQSQSVLVQFTNVSGAAGHIFGMIQAANCRMFINPSNLGNTYYSNGSGNTGGVPDTTAGNLAVAGSSAYRNGAPHAGVIAAYGAVPVVACWIGRANGGLFQAAYIQALALYDCTLTAPQVLAVATAMSLL